MAKTGAFLRVNAPKNLEGEMRGRMAKALRPVGEEVLAIIKDVTPVAYANLTTRYGWPRSFQSASKKPRGRRQGGQLRRSLTLEIDEDALQAVFRARTPYAVFVHDGGLHFVGRAYVARPIQEEGGPLLERELKIVFAEDFV